MKNIDRLARSITKNGSKNILIHTIPETNNWIICEKIDKIWILTLSDPSKNVTFNLGTTTDKQHVRIWNQLIAENNKKATQLSLANELRKKLAKFNKESLNEFKNLTNIRTVEIPVPNTKFCVLGEQQKNKLWNTYLIDPMSNYQEVLKQDLTTEEFILFSHLSLKTPFPYDDETKNSTILENLIKNLTNIKHENNTNIKSTKLRINSKNSTKNRKNIRNINRHKITRK